MDKLHALLFHMLGPAPVYAYLVLAAFIPANYFVDKAKWTTAENVMQLLARFILKIPAVGNIVALVPGIGDLLHSAANDATGALPPTLHMALKRMRKPPPAATAALLLVGLVTLQGCGFGTCMIGKIKSQYQNVIAEVAIDLSTADYVDSLTTLAGAVGSDLVNCTVQAVVNYEQSKKTAAVKGQNTAVIERGQLWLNTHKTVACADVRHVS